jgi:hypothetical protein
MSDGAVVVAVTVRLLPGFAGLGETVHADSEAGSVQEKLTLWFIPPSAPTANVKVAVCPCETVADEEEPEGVVSV